MSESITRSQRPRFAFVFSSLHFGGAERVAMNLADALDELGFAVDFVVMDASGEFIDHARERHRVINLACTRTYQLPVRLAHYLRRVKPAACVSSFWKLNLCLSIARIAAPGTAVGLWEHASPLSQHTLSPPWLFAPSATILYRLATRVVAVSDMVAADVRRASWLPRDLIRTVPNAVRPPATGTPTGRDSRRIIWVGRFAEVKNPMLALAAFALLPDDQGHSLVMVGDGPLRDSVAAEAKTLGLADRVTFTGFVNEPYDLMAGAGVLLLSSVAEGLPTVVIEALYLGLNIVSTDCGGGVHEILEDGRLGSIVPADAGALAQAILQRIENPIPSDALQRGADRYQPQRAAGKMLNALNMNQSAF